MNEQQGSIGDHITNEVDSEDPHFEKLHRVVSVSLCNAARHWRQYIPSAILRHLHVGNWQQATDLELLEKQQITHVLNVAEQEFKTESDFYGPRIHYKGFETWDDELFDMSPLFESCNAFIDDAKERGGACLCHCRAGVSRSVTVVAAYLMKSQRITAAEALYKVRQSRPIASPNDGFLRQLLAYQRDLGISFEGADALNIDQSCEYEPQAIRPWVDGDG